MSRAAEMLREFHQAFDCCQSAEQRRTLHTEEHAELMDALDDASSRPGEAPSHIEARKALARELADNVYILYGTAERLGIDLDAAVGEVHRANMAKLPDCEECRTWIRADARAVCPECHGTGKGKPIKRDDGKVLKPEGWQKPSMAGAVAAKA